MTGTQDAKLTDERHASVGAMLLAQVEKSGDREAFRHRNEHGSWVSLSWNQTRDAIFEVAAGLIALGIEREERVAIAASTRMEWILTDLGTMCAGGATTTVYPSTKEADVGFILADSDSKIVVVEDAEQLAKVLGQMDDLPQVHKLVLMDGDSDDDRVLTFARLRELGREHLAENPDSVTSRIAGSEPEHLSTLIYTSGTTGKPKGVPLVHDAWTYEGRAIEVYDLLQPDDLQFLWLPLSHVFGKALMALQLQIGFATAVDGNLDRIVDGLGEVHPTFMCGAPRIYEKVRNKVLMGANQGVKKKIFDWAFSVGEKSVEYRVNNRPMPALLNAQYKLADKLVFSKIKDRMGGRIKFFVSGSAKLNSHVQRWFYAAGLLIIEGYGLTETSAVTFVNSPREPRLGTVGPPVPGTEMKLADDGEVLIKGPGVSRGYHNNDEEAAKSFVDGWFHTGDIGKVDQDGYLTITDRKKDLIKTSGGKYVAPQKVEGAVVAACSLVSQVIVQGESRQYISALLSLDPDAVAAWAEQNGQSGSYEELVECKAIREAIDRDVETANSGLERWETIKKFAILPTELSVEDGEVTPSMKIRRAAVGKRYADLIDSLY